MPRNLEFTDFERKMVIGLCLEKKHSFSEIAAIVECSKGTVQGVITRYKDSECTTVVHRTGRPPKLSVGDKRQLLRETKKDRSATLDQLTEEFNKNLTVSVSSKNSTAFSTSLRLLQ